MAKLIKVVASRTPKKPKLLIEERRRRILDMVNSQERVTVSDLVEAFGISAVTIRGDLDALDEQGGLVRSHGGAVKRLNPLQDYPIQVKEILHHAAKVRIAQAAARLIRPDQKIILDSGTTTAEIARQIKHSKFGSLTVITNALNIAMELANLPFVSVIMLGGMLRQMSYSLVGPACGTDSYRLECGSRVPGRGWPRSGAGTFNAGCLRGKAQCPHDSRVKTSDRGC